MKKKIVVVKQEGVKDCGVASLLSIIRYYGGNISIEKLREETKATKHGITAFHIVCCANKLGFSSKGIKCKEIQDLKKINLPAIAHVIINNSYKHYVVIYKIDFKKSIITLMDPSCGIKKISFDEFNNIWSKVIIDLFPLRKIPYYKQSKTITKLIREILLSNKKIILFIFIMSVFVTFANIINSYYFKIIIDNSYLFTNNIVCILFLFIFVLILKISSDYIRNKLIYNLQKKLDFSLVTKSFNQIINLPYNYFKNKTSGEMISRINDLNYIKEVVSRVILSVFMDLVIIVLVFVVLLKINYILCGITVLISFLYLFVAIIFSSLFKKEIISSQEKFSLVNSYMIESTNGFETIKNMNLENKITNNLENKYINYLESEYKIKKYNNIQQTLKEIIGSFGTFLILSVGYLFVNKGMITIGELITYNSLLMYFLNPIRNILDLEPLIRYASSSIKRINELFDVDKEELTIDKKYVGKTIQGKIEFKNLSYSFNDKDMIIKNFNLKINKGDKIAIIGKSGCGKSTILKLLLNYYKINNGKVFIDDKDINDYNLKELRNNIIYVSQDETLFTDSVINNILIKNNIDYDTFLDKCRLTEVNSICENKYLGYDFLLEENGFNLSSGERERIILCRTLTKEANIIILDEALNKVDVDTERRILKNILKNNKDKTIIMVSHRLENLDLFDKIVTIKNGKIGKIIKKRGYHYG